MTCHKIRYHRALDLIKEEAEAQQQKQSTAKMSAEGLADLVLDTIIAKLGAKGAATMACVSTRFRDSAYADNIWQEFCLRDLDLSVKEDPSGNPTPSFKDTYRIWKESFQMYPWPLVRRAKRCWSVLKTWMAENFPEAAKTLLSGATESDLDEIEIKLHLKLPAPTRLLYRFCAGQELPDLECEKKYYSGSLGIVGGYCFYDHLVNVYLTSLWRMIPETRTLRKYIGSAAFSKHILVAACPYEGKMFSLNCDDGQLYVGTKNLAVHGEMLPCVPYALLNLEEGHQLQDGLLLWLEEHGRRLQSGIIHMRSDGENQSISLFPESEPSCSTAVTKCVQVRASAVFVPELCDLLSDEKYFYAYSIRMCLLPQVHMHGLLFNSCQLSSRRWIIRADETVVSDFRAEGVIGLYPLLHPDGKEFVYESCTPLPSSPGSIEGSFTFIPGRLISPKGDPFDVEVARFPLERPEYIF